MFNIILTYVDLTHPPSWESSLPKAIRLAQTCNAKLHVMTCVPNFGMTIVEQFFPEDFDESKVQREAMHQLEAFIDEHVPAEIETKAIIGEGHMRDCILDVSTHTQCDLIILAPSRERNHFYSLGANAAHVMRHAGCSVMIVR